MYDFGMKHGVVCQILTLGAFLWRTAYFQKFHQDLFSNQPFSTLNFLFFRSLSCANKSMESGIFLSIFQNIKALIEA